MNEFKGKLIVFSAPSGSGKTTIVRHLLNQEQFQLEFSISATSREARGNEKDGEDFNAKRAIDMALAVKFLPELQCTTQATEEFDCIDLAKLLVYNQVIEDKDWYSRYYAQLFPNAKITIKQAFAPFGKILGADGIVLLDNIYLEQEQIKSFQKISLPVTIYDPASDSNSFGFIELEVVG